MDTVDDTFNDSFYNVWWQFDVMNYGKFLFYIAFIINIGTWIAITYSPSNPDTSLVVSIPTPVAK